MIVKLNNLVHSGKIRELLNQPDLWNSIDITYHKPRVERVWTQLENLRLNLHIIHPCELNDSLYHPHPWPSAIFITKGIYVTGFGSNLGLDPPPIISTMILPENSWYEMLEPSGWHYVMPLREPSHSVMLSGEPWNRELPSFDMGEMAPLSTHRKNEIIEIFKSYF